MQNIALGATKYVDKFLYLIFGPIMRRFVVVSAENVEDVLRQTRQLREQGFLTSIDLMVEDLSDDATILRVREFYSQLLLHMRRGDRTSIVIKPTALGLDLSNTSVHKAKERFAKHLYVLLATLARVGRAGSEKPIEIEVDAESTRTIGPAYQVITSLRRIFPQIAYPLRVALPMHLKVLPGLCDGHDLLNYPVRIVKGTGVYNEPSEKLVGDDVMLARYEEYFLDCLKRKSLPFIATMHDEKLLRRVIRKAESLGFTKNDFVIQMLYGLWPWLGRRLLHEGYRVSIYVPVVLPWCTHASDGYVVRRVSMFRTLFLKLFSAHKASS